MGEPPAGEEARHLADPAGIGHVQQGLHAVGDGGGEEHVAARVGVVDVEVGERADLARVFRVRPDVEDAHAARAPVGAVHEEQPAVGVDPEAMGGAEGLVPGLDPPRVIGVLHADDVEPPGRLRRRVDVLAVGPDLAPLAVGAGHEGDVARARGIRDLHDGGPGGDSGQREAPAACRRVAPVAGGGERGPLRPSDLVPGRGRLRERGEVQVGEERHVEGPRRRGGRSDGDGRGRAGRARAAGGQGEPREEGDRDGRHAEAA